METGYKLESIQPRFLRYRNHYKVYVLGFALLSCLIFSFWSIRIFNDGFSHVLKNFSFELCISFLFFTVSGSFYFFWLRQRLKKSVQVFEDHLKVHNGKTSETVTYSEIESVSIVCWSIFYVKMKSGLKFYFNSSIERVDYIWEGIYKARPDLISHKAFETYRVKLVQYDHHQKRKDWFFKHKLIDIFNWTVLPFMFVTLTYIFQSQSIEIHQQGLYFFRLFMYAMLTLLVIAFMYSMILKKLIFDRKVKDQMESEVKVRDLEFEGVILQRSKVFQLFTVCFILAVLVKLDMNLFSVTKVKDDIAAFKLKKGTTLVVDNRYNCVGCKFRLHDGDLVIFGRGHIGQILAKEGDMVGQVGQDQTGRTIASENVQEVPQGHVAIRAANGKDIMFVKIEELIGRIQK